MLNLLKLRYKTGPQFLENFIYLKYNLNANHALKLINTTHCRTAKFIWYLAYRTQDKKITSDRILFQSTPIPTPLVSDTTVALLLKNEGLQAVSTRKTNNWRVTNCCTYIINKLRTQQKTNWYVFGLQSQLESVFSDSWLDSLTRASHDWITVESYQRTAVVEIVWF